MNDWHVPDEPAEPPSLHAQAAGLYQQAVIEVLGCLLAGEGRLLGRKVTLAWPDGPPPQWSPDALHLLGNRWKRDARDGINHWSETATAAANACAQEVIMESLALGQWFFLKRGENGEPDRLEPR